MEVGGQLHAPAALTLRKKPPVPWNSRMGGAQSRSLINILLTIILQTKLPLFFEQHAISYIEVTEVKPQASYTTVLNYDVLKTYPLLN
jgi:hypothetical protein